MTCVKNLTTSTAGADRRRRLLRRTVFAACVICLALSACGAPPKRFISRDVDFAALKKIAVLPLDNFTKNEYAGEKIRSIVSAEFLSRGIEAVEPGEVTNALRELNVKSLKLLTAADFQKMAKVLGADALITGSVEAFEISKGISASYPEVSIHLMSHHASTGKIIWSAWHTSGGASFGTRHFGTEGMTLSEAAQKVVRETIETFLRGQ